jgi:predicted SAM-dependent methyltransferase
MKIDLGCGRRKRLGYFGVDCQSLPGVDLVCDCNEVIPLPDNSAEEIIAHDFLEHVRIDRRIHIMTEVWRLLKPNGFFISSTPNAAQGQGFYQDPTHFSPWCKNSFLYYSDDAHRALYGIKAKFEILSLEVTPLNSLDVSYVKATLRCVK